MSKRANSESMKWPTDKDKYDKHYQRAFDKTIIICKYCKDGCPACNWMGFFEAKPTSCADNCKSGDKQR